MPGSSIILPGFNVGKEQGGRLCAGASSQTSSHGSSTGSSPLGAGRCPWHVISMPYADASDERAPSPITMQHFVISCGSCLPVFPGQNPSVWFPAAWQLQGEISLASSMEAHLTGPPPAATGLQSPRADQFQSSRHPWTSSKGPFQKPAWGGKEKGGNQDWCFGFGDVFHFWWWRNCIKAEQVLIARNSLSLLCPVPDWSSGTWEPWSLHHLAPSAQWTPVHEQS